MEKFDEYFIAELMSQDMTYEEAIRVASAEMEGVAVTKSATVHGLQTYCNVLNYDEDLKPSKGAKEGRQKCTKEVQEWLGQNGFKTIEDYINSREV